MKRFKYGLNSQVLSSTNMQELKTIGVIETVPGDTIGGKTQLQTLSESAGKVINNRCYMDVYAFYVPYRLVWEEWPDFIAGDDTKTVPVATVNEGNLAQKSLAKRNTTAQSIRGPAQVNLFAYRAYNLIWNKFFRTQGLPEIGLDEPTVQRAPLRATTFNQRLKEATDLLDQTIDVSGATITTQDIRQAFSQDRFNKTRAYYGSKYVDYLAALGVEASWTILDEPELIGASSNRLKFNMVDSNSEIEAVSTDPNVPDFVGAVAGRWQGTQMMSIRRTFAPEHGHIMVVAVPRIELELDNSKGIIANYKTQRDQWFSPEWETERKQEWFPYSDPVSETALYTEKFDDYRVGQNYIDNQTSFNGTWVEAPAVAAPTEKDILYPDTSLVSAVLNDQYAGIEFNLNAQHRLTRTSPVRPAQSVKGVS